MPGGMMLVAYQGSGGYTGRSTSETRTPSLAISSSVIVTGYVNFWSSAMVACHSSKMQVT
jgi:hypothetical protein